MGPRLKASRHVAFVIACALAFAPAATCLAAALAGPPGKACHGSERPAQGGSIDPNCCPGDSPSSQSRTSTQQTVDSMAPSSLPVVVLPLLAALQPGMRVALSEVATTTARPPGTPTYVLVSSF